MRTPVMPTSPPARAPRDCRITPYRDGPILVRGPFRLVDDDGRVIEVRRKTVALCRCGRSRLGALCDGTHRIVGFTADGGFGGAARTAAEAEATPSA